jgi:hypothetical protein
VSWLYQPLPLASTLSVTDVTVALDASATEVATGHGTLVYAEESFALTGSASAAEAGTLTYFGFAGQEIASAQGSFVKTDFVRLRSRKVGGASTADRLLDGIQAQAQAGTATKVLSVLLGGTGITTAQQSFPSKSVARLLVGQERTTGRGTVVYTPQGTGSIPSWVQLPTQVDEETYYNTDFGVGTGKDVAWAWTAADKAIEFTVTPPAGVATSPKDIHNETEGDDLWSHYMQYKRTGNSTHLNWATAWRNYFVNVYLDGDLKGGNEDNPSGSGRNGDHLYGQGLVLWGMERNDLAARNAALAIAATMEPQTLALVPGTSNLTASGGRRFARRLLFYSYIVMMEPIPRWIACRDNLIECWLQSPNWEDSSNGIIVSGGNHFDGRTAFELGAAGGLGVDQYDAGYRFISAFQWAILYEAFWVSYKMTGRTDVRDMLVQMARYILYYAWDPTHVNAMSGLRFGHEPDGTHWHSGFDDFSIAAGSGPGQLPNTAQGPPDPAWTDPNSAPADNYETSHVNVLVYAYKITGETAFLKRAREHFRQATCYNGTDKGSTKLAEDQVHFYTDTLCDPSNIYFEYNKGMSQYCSRIFENGGLPEVESSATWTPPYPVPTSPGQVVKIAGGVASAANPNGPATNANPDSVTVTHQGGDTTPSAYPTNVFHDVRPIEIGGNANGMIHSNDSRCKFIESYSPGGAIVQVGSGGHSESNNFGACLFDFTDARWKRVWTTQGNPGVDNVSSGNVDVRSTRVHNCLNWEDDLYGWFGGNHLPDSETPCWNPDHWTSGADAAHVSHNPLTPDPRDMSWEVSMLESSFWVQSKAGTTHAWPYPGEFGGDQNGRFLSDGYVTNSGRFQPTLAGTLEPTQSELPAPGHVWDHLYELTPDEGGGPQGSIIVGLKQNISHNGQTAQEISHRYDLNTGIWHVFSTNESLGSVSNPTDGGPANQSGAMAGCEHVARDDLSPPVPHRAFMVAKALRTNRVNYMNISDRTWRNFHAGSGGVVPDGNTEQMYIDPVRRLLILTCAVAPHLLAIDLQTLGTTGTPEPTPSQALGGWKVIPYDDIPGVQSVPPNFCSINGDHMSGFGAGRCLWRYYPPNGKFYRLNLGSMLDSSVAPPYPNITVMQRLTPPAIVTGTRPNFYYTTESLSGRWTLDEIPLGLSLPVPDSGAVKRAAGFSWFHYVPSLQCFAYAPCDYGSGYPTVRRCVYLIKPA